MLCRSEFVGPVQSAILRGVVYREKTMAVCQPIKLNHVGADILPRRRFYCNGADLVLTAQISIFR